MTQKKAIILSILAAILVFAGIGLFFDLNLVRWMSCTSPFASPADQDSDLCKRLDRTP